ncbi:MAG: telomerase inhibitor [Claussenomyces sp. TS43310]|nr:MAG: telomerase inhibitor [Claussenomyces sp. TS43310]
MTAQGWQPGDYLGAKDAPHAELHTAANASYIRVLIKDDNLGLGAKKGSGIAPGECTGLDVFQNLLGRLNGKDEDEIFKEQKSREDLKRAIYTEQRWGSVRFVRGGLLVGDKIQDLIDHEAERLKQLKGNGPIQSEESEGTLGEEDISERSVAKPKKAKKERKSKAEPQNTKEDAIIARESRKEEKRRLKKESRDTTTNEHSLEDNTSDRRKKKRGREAQTEEVPSTMNAPETREETKARKRAKKEQKVPELNKDPITQTPEKKQKDRRKSKTPAEVVAPVHTPSSVATQSAATTSIGQPGTPQSIAGDRHAVRRRFIAQKRMAVMDAASLNQIFMIKS